MIIEKSIPKSHPTAVKIKDQVQYLQETTYIESSLIESYQKLWLDVEKLEGEGAVYILYRYKACLPILDKNTQVHMLIASIFKTDQQVTLPWEV
jgi:hypothetical protein